MGFESHAGTKDLLLFCFHFSVSQSVLLSYFEQPSSLCHSEQNFFERISDRPSAVLLNYTDMMYRGADKSLARPTSRCILFDGKNISFDASLVIYIYIYIYINSINIPTVMIINRIYEHQYLLSL